MPLFKLPQRDVQDDKTLVNKAKGGKKSPSTVKGGKGLATKIANIKAKVLQSLSKYEDETLLIRDEQTLHDYISRAIEVGYIAIDTETTGLDPISDECVGICIYTKGQKTAYVPMNHISYVTMEKCDNQLSKEVVATELERLNTAQTKVIMFNATFDIRVIKNQIGVRLTCYWDCSIGAKILNENESAEFDEEEGKRRKSGLKQLHRRYVLNGIGDAFSFDELFKGVKFSLVPINIGYLYAAHDAIITYELWEFQKQYIYYDKECTFSDRNGMNGASWTFFNIEMPCVDVVVDMEDNGVAIDTEYAKTLSERYNKILREREQDFYNACAEYEEQIAEWRRRNPTSKLDNPINVSSPQQLSILLYDIIGLDAGVDKKTKKPIRETGKNIIGNFDNDVCRAILAYKEIEKLVSTYIDKLPNCLNPKDGRLHGKFNQYGAKTGRFSSSNPNLQNIPSHNKDIRPMFVATKGYVMMSSDFSQQEPKCLAALCRKDGDSQMYDTFMQGKDLYSEIASKAFNKPYEECREFNVDGSTNKEGKERRTQAKSILLGVLYGRGTASIAEQLGCSTEKAEAIKESVFNGFPAIREFEQRSIQMAQDEGYMTTVCGRKRRLPDMQLPEYDFKWEVGYVPMGDILDFDDLDIEVPYRKQVEYTNKLNSAYGKRKNNVIEQAKREHILIYNNGGKIAEATRQCVNSRIQGSAADLTKLAMIALYINERLKELGFRILIQVHDEIIAECPEENAKECSTLLAQIMSQAAEQVLEMPIKCDVEITKAWYGEKVELC